MHNLTNTHYYDGKIATQLLADLSLAQALSNEEKQVKVAQLVTKCQQLPAIFSPVALHYLNLIFKEMGQPNNYDLTNQLNADDLLYLASTIEEPAFLLLLNEQLEDMRTGFCAQGRTHRLFQSLVPFL